MFRGKENVLPLSSEQKQFLKIPKQLPENQKKKGRPRLLSIENIRLSSFQSKNNLNLSPTLKSAGSFSGSRFTIYNENKGITVIAPKQKEKNKKSVAVSPPKKKVSFKISPEDAAADFPEVFVDESTAAGSSSVKTPAKSPASVDQLSQKSKFRHVKHFFKDIEKKKSPECVKKVLKRRLSEKIIGNVAYFEALPLKRITQLKDEDKKFRKTPEDTKFNLPPLQQIKKVRLEAFEKKKVKNPPGNWNFCNEIQLEYAGEMMEAFEKKEANRRSVSLAILRGNVTPRQRQILVKHLININRQFNYPSFLTYNAVRLLDDVLSAIPSISLEKLQLYELTSLWIILKSNHMFHRIPLSDKMAELSNGACDKLQVTKCEREILTCVNYQVLYDDLASIVNLCIFTDPKLRSVDPEKIHIMYYFTGYMIDACLFDEELMRESSILLASAIADLSVVTIMSSAITSISELSSSKWTPNYGKRFSKEEKIRVHSMILHQVKKSLLRGTLESVVYAKYKQSRYGRISKYLANVVKTII